MTVTVFGSINLDLIFAVPRLPTPGETILGPGTRVEPGGKGANQAVAAARDGARAIMAGAIGTDPLADAALVGLIAAGVDITRVARVPGSTGCAAICTDTDGRNLIAVGSGANTLARADQVEDALLGPGHTVLMQMELPADQVVALIRRASGARLILNLAPALPLPTQALRAVDILILNEPEAAWLAHELGTAADAPALQSALGRTVIRTLGEQGVDYATPSEAGRLPAHRVDVRDTTAAGDCFTGTLAAALDRGLPLQAALARANAAAALCCTRPGSQGSMPTAAEIDAASPKPDGPIVTAARTGGRPDNGPVSPPATPAPAAPSPAGTRG